MVKVITIRDCRATKSVFVRKQLLASALDSWALCKPCLDDAKTRAIAGRQKMWDYFPPFLTLKNDI
ncbi:hypothetical protein B0H19DRAFT_1137100 [Mycena capillaripes]|nr:hypothetical protein B0H19DRAFT_1137100 [Mycena capillaripes]